MLLHAPWGGRDAVEGAQVLDVFAGTGALGLEALSRGAAHATFIEHDRAALAALRANIAACTQSNAARVLALDALAVPSGRNASLIFLDPPYGRDLVRRALQRLRAAGRIAPAALIVAETGRDEPPPATSAARRACARRRADQHLARGVIPGFGTVIARRGPGYPYQQSAATDGRDTPGHDGSRRGP